MRHETAGLHSGGMRLAMRAVGIIVLIGAVAYLAPRIAISLFVSPAALSQSLRETAKANGGFLLDHSQEATIMLWPRPRLRIANAVLRRADGTIVAEADRLSADIPLFSGLGEDARLLSMRLGGLRIHAPATGAGKPGAVLLAQAGGLSSLLNAETLGALAAIEGRLQVDGGSILPEDRAEPILSEMTLNLSHMAADAPLDIRLDGMAGGKAVGLDILVPAPGRLAAGEETALTVSSSMPGLNARFEGRASLSQTSFLSGTLTLADADPAGFIDWSGLTTPGMETVKTASLTTKLSASGRTIRFDTLDLSINDTRASGVLELALPEGGTPKATGTLAFADFDIDDVKTLQPLAERFLARDASGNLRPTANLDLRVSTRRAMIGGVSLADVAASMIVGKDHILLDIGDSDFAGGRLTGRLTSGQPAIGKGFKLQAMLRDIDVAQMDGASMFGQLWPESGNGEADIDVTVGHLAQGGYPGEIKGRAVFRVNQGSLAHFGRASLAALADGAAMPVPLDSSRNSFSFDTLNLTALVVDGLVFPSVDAQGPDGSLTMTGGETHGDGADFGLDGQLQTPDSKTLPLSFRIEGQPSRMHIMRVQTGSNPPPE